MCPHALPLPMTEAICTFLSRCRLKGTWSRARSNSLQPEAQSFVLCFNCIDPVENMVLKNQMNQTQKDRIHPHVEYEKVDLREAEGRAGVTRGWGREKTKISGEARIGRSWPAGARPGRLGGVGARILFHRTVIG